jgi:hypothetical protein
VIDFIVKNAQLIIAISWVLTAVSMIGLLPVVWMKWSDWRYQLQYRRHLRVTAMCMARLAVFDSWVRSGGRKEPICEDLERSLREDYAASAARCGPEYLNEFVMHEERADADLMALINTHRLPSGRSTEEGSNEKEDC